MSDVLIPDSLLAELTAIHESTFRSTCRILYRPKTGRRAGGQDALGSETDRYATPIPCAAVVGGGPGISSDTERVVGERRTSVGLAAIQLPIRTLIGDPPVMTAVDVQPDDTIEVTTTVHDRTFVDRYKVVGTPTVGSYATALNVSGYRIPE